LDISNAAAGIFFCEKESGRKMFQDLVLSEVAPVCCVAFLWFSNYAFLFYGNIFAAFVTKIKPSRRLVFWNDLTLMPLLLLLIRPSFRPPIKRSSKHFRYALAITLIYGLELIFLLLNTFQIPESILQDPLVEKCIPRARTLIILCQIQACVFSSNRHMGTHANFGHAPGAAGSDGAELELLLYYCQLVSADDPDCAAATHRLGSAEALVRLGGDGKRHD
jgi:hypothetical protein